MPYTSQPVPWGTFLFLRMYLMESVRKITLLTIYSELGIFCYFPKSLVLRPLFYPDFISGEADAIKVK